MAKKQQSLSSPDALRAYVVNNQHSVFLPVCSVCGKPVVDLDKANLVVDKCDLDPEVVEVGGLSLQAMSGRVLAVHHSCDRERLKPWVRASAVFRSDQRTARDMVLEDVLAFEKKAS